MNLKPHQSCLGKLPFLSLKMSQLQSATALLLVKVGSRCEKGRIAGLSHFLEHMVFKGTRDYPTALDLASAVDAVGAEFNAFTSKEYTGFYVKAASEHLDLALKVLSQLVWQPLLRTKDIEREKGVIIEEINMRNDNPMLKVEEEFEVLLYGKSPLGNEVIGSKETVKGMKREDFIRFRSYWYKPRNMVLALVGGIEGKEKLASAYFNQSSGAKKEIKQPDKLNFKQEKPGLRVKYKQTEQTHLCLGVRTFPRGHPDRYRLAVLATLLGGNMSSRLFTEVREKRGLAYYIKSDINTYFDNGYLVIQAGVDNRQTEEAMKVILTCLREVVGSVKQAELDRAREYLKGKLALGLEDSQAVASFFSKHLLLEGEIRTPREIVRRLEKVSLADLRRISQKIFVNQRLNLALIGPYKEEERFREILRF